MSASLAQSKTLLVVSPDPLFTAKLDTKLDAERAAGRTATQWTIRLVPPSLVAAFVREARPDVAIIDVNAWSAQDNDELRVLRRATRGLPLVAVRESSGSADADDALIRGGVQEIVDRAFDRGVMLSAALRRAVDRVVASQNLFAEASDADAGGDSAAGAQKRLRIIMHELVTPLTAIRLGAAAIAARLPPSSESEEEVDMVARAAELMQRILRDLHAEQALEPEGLLARKTIALHGLVDTVQQLLAPFAAQRRVLLTGSCGAGVPPVHVDPDRLLQVLTNLVGNAIKFTPPGGRVDVSARPVQGGAKAGDTRADAAARVIRVAVEDTGVGIPSDELPHVFEWFWHSRNVARGGAGLGLAIAKMLVEAHGAELNVESVAGHGTTFWFDLSGPG